jgi:hypothetical protein
MTDQTTIDDGVSDEEYIAIARTEYQRDGEIEIDEGATVSRSDDGGAYVQAWVWVYNPKTLEDEDDQEPTDPENIYGLASMRQSVEEDRAKRGR